MLLGVAGAARLAGRAGFSPVPVPLLAGVLIGSVGPLARTLAPSRSVVDLGTQVGVVLLLFAVGLDHGAGDRVAAVATGPGGVRLGLVDGLLNAVPGAAAGLLLGYGLRGAALLGGITWASSWTAAGELLGRRGRLGNRETPAVLAVLVLEHAGLAAYLPLATALLAGGGTSAVAASLLAATGALLGAAWIVVHWASRFRAAVFRPGVAPAKMLLTLAGVALAGAGVAAQARIPAAGAAFLAGAVLAGPETDPGAGLSPEWSPRPAIDLLRELSLVAVSLLAGVSAGRAGGLGGPAGTGILLGVLISATKLATGGWAAGGLGAGPAGRLRAGTALVARGEVSVALAALAAGAGLHRLAATGLAVVFASGLLAAGLDRAARRTAVPARSHGGRSP